MVNHRAEKSKHIRLGAMMFFEYSIWGSWAVVLGAYLGSSPDGANNVLYLSYTSRQIGAIFSILPLAMFATPFLFGYLADKVMPSQNILGVCHLAAALALFYAGAETEYHKLLQYLILYAIFFAPTLAITNSIALSHLKDAEREFGRIRVWGTVGWIVSGWALSAWRTWFCNVRGDLFYLAAFFAVISGVYSFALPNTPPSKTQGSRTLLRDVLGLFSNRNFTVLLIINSIVATQFDFYYMLASPFLEQIGFSRSSVPGLMTIAQIAEIIAMAVLLPKALHNLGMKKVILLGAIAWPIRFAVFALFPFKAAAAAALSLHSICFVFLFAASFIYVDKSVHQEIRVTAQAVTASIVWGAARFVGARMTGWIKGVYTVDGFTDYGLVFVIPAIITLTCAIAFAFLFSDKQPQV